MNEPSNFVDGSITGCTNNSLDNPPFVPPGKMCQSGTSLILIRLKQTPAAVYFSSGILLNAPTSLSLLPCSSGKWSCLCSYACILICACRFVSGDRVCSADQLHLKCAFIFHCEGGLPFIPEALLLNVVIWKGQIHSNVQISSIFQCIFTWALFSVCSTGHL